MEKLIRSFHCEDFWKRIAAPGNLINLFLILLLIVTGLTLCLALKADAHVYLFITMGW